MGARSQSLRKSGQFLSGEKIIIDSSFHGRNPFVNQVSFFVEIADERIWIYGSQSLRKSGQFLS